MIVEDSRLARLELKSQLNHIDYMSCVAEAENIEQAITKYDEHKPQLIFLDIDLPDGNGFDFLTQLETPPHVIFTTAYQEFALKAFEQDAIDYLLKPFTQERLIKACERFKTTYQYDSHPKPEDQMLLTSQFFVKDGNHCHLITLADVERFEAMGNYTKVYFEQQKPLVYRTLSQIEQRLPEGKFFRVSRQNIIQLDKIQKVDLCSSGGLELTLKSGVKVDVSRRQTSLFKSMLAL